MTQAKTLASLAPNLLARKGGARPAMRPQYQRLPSAVVGEKALQDSGGNGTTLAPAFAVERETLAAAALTQESTSVRSTQQPASCAAQEPTSTPERKRSVTVRLDQHRHLQLRLAGVLENRSAQDLVREALDRMFADILGQNYLS